MTVRGGGLVVVVVAVLVAVLASTAQATPRACPAMPDEITDTALTDTDRIVRELRELRRELAGTCQSERDGHIETRDGLDQARATAITNGTEAHADAVAIVDAIDGIEPAASPGLDDSNPAYVRLASSDTQAQIATDGLRAALWCIAGLLVVGIAAPFLLRTFRA